MFESAAMLHQLIAVSLLFGSAQATSRGALESACTNAAMAPTGHGTNTASGASPYGITFNSDQYSAGGSLTVTLAGSETFRGFLILALPADNPTGSPVGSFAAKDSAEANLVQTRCSSMGLTHTLDFKQLVPNRDKIELTWSAPAALAGNLIFYVTFVKVETEYWVKQASPPVWDGVSPRPTTSAPSAVTDPPALNPAVMNTGCGNTMGCYSDCEGDSCDFLVTWKKLDNKVEFELFATLTDSQGYVALGLAPAASMMDVSIIACTADGRRTSEVEQHYATNRDGPSHVATGPISGESNVAAVQAENSPKTMSCRFTYDNDIAKQEPAMWKDLDQEWYLFVARGAYFPLTLAIHDEIPKISPVTVQLTDTNYPSITGLRINYLIKAHACIMVIAWVFCASVGLILARYFKPMWSNTKACGQKVWFSYHRALMLCAMFLTIIGFIIILVHQQGRFVTPKDLPGKAHPILGLIAIICALLNPIIAAFRCHPGDSKRALFNWVHWFIGTVAHVFAIASVILGCLFYGFDKAALPWWLWLACIGFAAFHVLFVITLELYTRLSSVNSDVDVSGPKPSELAINQPASEKEEKSEVVAIFLGMLLSNAVVPGWITYVMMVFCIVHVCVEFILEIHQCCMYDKNRDRQDEHNANKGANSMEPEYAGRRFKCVMLVFYMVVVTVITIALVAIIAAWGSAPGTTA